MSHRIDLPDGGWADIADPKELSNRSRKLLRRYAFPAYNARDHFADVVIPDGATDEQKAEAAIDALAATDPADLELVDNMQAAFIVAYVVAWSRTDALPTMDTVDDLPGPVFDVLAAETGKLGDGAVAFTPDDALDPASPTVPSPV